MNKYNFGWCIFVGSVPYQVAVSLIFKEPLNYSRNSVSSAWLFLASKALSRPRKCPSEGSFLYPTNHRTLWYQIRTLFNQICQSLQKIFQVRTWLWNHFELQIEREVLWLRQNVDGMAGVDPSLDGKSTSFYEKTTILLWFKKNYRRELFQGLNTSCRILWFLSTNFT